MKVIFFTFHNSYYGANRSLLSLIIGLQQKDVKAHVIVASEGEFSKQLKNHRIEYTLIPFRTWFSYRWKSSNPFFQFIRDLQQLLIGISNVIFNISLALIHLKFFKKLSPDAYYSNTSITPFGYVCAMLNNRKHYWHLREYGDLDYSLYPDFGWLISKRIISKSTTISISNSITDHFGLNGKSNSHIVYNGIFSKDDISSFAALKNSKQKQFNFLILGVINDNKGQMEAIKAILELKKNNIPAHLDIYGSGHIEELSKFIKANELDGIVNIYSYNESIVDIISKSFCVLVCSKFEAFGRVTAEAMSIGIPVIGRNSPSTNELIEDNISGLLYNADLFDLSKKMAHLMQDTLLYNSIVQHGQERASELFTIEGYVNKIYTILSNNN